jgi:hypothetical protein
LHVFEKFQRTNKEPMVQDRFFGHFRIIGERVGTSSLILKIQSRFNIPYSYPDFFLKT